MMWKIGDLELDGRVILGPMAGFTSRGYRAFMEPFGVAASVTEMTSDMGVIYGTDRTESDYVTFESERPTGLQLFGHDPECLAKAASKALEINPNIAFIDVNMGCPVPKISRSGAGCVLMKDPKLCGDIVRRIKGSVDVPVTAKVRLGWTMATVNFREVLDEVISAGADAVCLHPRTRDERYVGTPHYDMIEGLRKELSVPLIISGNIYSLDDAITAVNVTGAEGIMVARGGVGNPYLITQIDTYFREGIRLENPTISQQTHWCLALADRLLGEKDAIEAMAKMRSMAPKFIAGCDGCREYRYLLATETYSRDTLLDLLMEIEHYLGDQRIHVYNFLDCFRSGTDES
jgi:tRNA-dihydrouridine synthase B